MKKFGRIFGVAALAVATLTAGVVGLSGCGNKVKVNDIEKFVASESTVNSMDTGYKLKLQMPGSISAEGVVSLKEDNKVDFALVVDLSEVEVGATTAEAYLRGNEMFSREGGEGKYIKEILDVDNPTSEISSDLANLTQLADLTESIQQYLSVVKEMEGQGLKITKTDKNGVLRYKMTYKDASGNLSFVLEYKDNQLTKFAFNMSALGEKIVMEFELFSGEIEFPADLDTNFELSEEGEEGGEVVGGQEEGQLAA